MTRFFTRLAGVLVPLLAMAAAGTAQVSQVARPYGPAPDASLDGQRVDNLFYLITALTSAAFLIMLYMLLVPVFRDGEKPGRRAKYDHGVSLRDKRATAIVSVIVFLALDASVLFIALRDLHEAAWNVPTGDDVFRVEVLAQQWAWNFRTPGTDGEFGTGDDVVTINELNVPEQTPIVLNLKSKDVIHSFFLPDMRIKKDLNPGAVNEVWFQGEVPGTFTLLCAELCGFAHYQMSGTVTVMGEDWDDWYREASFMASLSHDPADEEAQWAWTWEE